MKLFFSALALVAVAALTPVSADGKDRVRVDTTLSAICADPHAWLNTPISFEARFHALGQIYQPFYTPFDAFSFSNFAAWDASKDLNVKAEFLDHCSTMYVDRRMYSDAMTSLGRLTPYQRFQAKGTVRQVFSGRAFIEITEIRPVGWWKFWWESTDWRNEAMAAR